MEHSFVGAELDKTICDTVLGIYPVLISDE